MANGHSVKRGGFKSNPHDDLHIKGHKFYDDLGLTGGSADDVVIGRGGNDQVVGQDGEDDLSGGAGDDLLVGAIWVDDEGTLDGETGLPIDSTDQDFNGVVDAEDTFTQDDYSDDFNAESSFAANGTDTIWYYDDDAAGSGVVDFIDLSAAVEFSDPTPEDGAPTTDQEKIDQLDAMFSYDTGTGAFKDSADNTWFNVYEDTGADVADTVYVEVDGDQFMWDGDGWALMA